MGLRPKYDRKGLAVYRAPQWKSVRFLAKRRDGFKCVSCGKRGRLEVDHIKPVRTHPELAFDLSNLQSLCPSCHGRKTRVECGLDDMDPKRLAWRNFVKELSQPKELSNA